jgi:hypothetical protein
VAACLVAGALGLSPRRKDQQSRDRADHIRRATGLRTLKTLVERRERTRWQINMLYQLPAFLRLIRIGRPWLTGRWMMYRAFFGLRTRQSPAIGCDGSTTGTRWQVLGRRGTQVPFQCSWPAVRKPPRATLLPRRCSLRLGRRAEICGGGVGFDAFNRSATSPSFVSGISSSGAPNVPTAGLVVLTQDGEPQRLNLSRWRSGSDANLTKPGRSNAIRFRPRAG